MSNKVKIAIDAMGGENSPRKIIKGIEISLKSNQENFFYLYGKKDVLEKEIYNKNNSNSKKAFFNKYLEQNETKIQYFDTNLMKYFNKYEAFCFDLKPDSVLKGDLFFNYK